MEQHGDNNCVGWRENDGPFQWISYAETWERAINTGSGLVNLGLEPVCLVL